MKPAASVMTAVGVDAAIDPLYRKAVVPLAVPLATMPIHPGRVRLLDGPFREAQVRDFAVLVELDADRFLSKFRLNADLKPLGEPYGGWEREGVAGQTLGHYLTACAMMSAATGDAALRDRAAYVVRQLAECQAAIGTGFVGAIPDWRDHFLKLKERAGKMTGWVPWYTLHKTLAGLRDAYLYCDDATALDVLVKLCAWIDGVVAPLNDDEMETMLATEHGGMNEALADTYLLTGDKRWLDLARRFTHKFVVDPLAKHVDTLDGLHANTQIPKLIGVVRLFAITGEAYFGASASFFWQTVVSERTYVIGGNSSREHFVPKGEARNWLNSATAETCNTHNMLRLTRQLHALVPLPAHFDFYERALVNHILGSNDPQRGMFGYFGMLRPGHFRVYSDPHEAMWCCVGTGMENPARYNESIYWMDAADGAVCVNLYVASELSLPEIGLTLRQECNLPADPVVKLRLTMTQAKSHRLRLRLPAWTDGQFEVRLDGMPAPIVSDSDGYLTFDRTWPAGDSCIELRFTPTVKQEPLQGAPDLRAYTFGPVVLAGDLGTGGLEQVQWYQGGHNQDAYRFMPDIAVPPLVGADASAVAGRIKLASRVPLKFSVETSHDVAAPNASVELIPYGDTHFRRYAVYWLTLTPDEWDKKRGEMAIEAERQRERLLRTLDDVQTGEQQSEVDHALAGEKTAGGATSFGKYRHAADGGWFSYTLAVDPNAANELVLLFWGGDDGARTFDILIDGVVIATQSLHTLKNGEMVEVVYPIDTKLTAGKRSAVVRFNAQPGNTAGGIYAVKMMRSADKKG